MNINTSSREEFEESVKTELQLAIDKAKKLRKKLRLLQEDIAQKEQKINNYQNIFQEIQQQLVKIQSILYASGTT